jgi:Uma2 family endonuclease
MSRASVEDLPCYTVADYAQWEGAWELIHGIPYAKSPAATIRHQSISQRIAAELSRKLADCPNCQPLLPVDWKIAEDTVVQPDNLVVCGPIDGQYLTRAPVVVFEVISPATARKDRGLKFDLYQREGVAYYVIVDPDTATARLFVLNEHRRYASPGDHHDTTFEFEFDGCRVSFNFAAIWPQG